MNYEPESYWLGQNEQLFAKEPWGYALPGLTYVDLGCAHPINKSLTHFVRDLGWRGVAIDANEAYRDEWNAADYGHHFVRAVLSDKPFVRFAYHENSFTSRISPSEATDHPDWWGINAIREEPATNLNDILAERTIGHIDLLCIDLEGYEFPVLQTLDFEKHTPTFIVSEYVTQGAGIDARVCNFLVARGYEVVRMTESNLIYRRK